MDQLKIIVGILFLVLILGQFSMVNAAEILELFTDREIYFDKQPLLIYGKSVANDDLLLRLIKPDGSFGPFDQIKTDEKGEFMHVLLNWPSPSTEFPYGTYTVEVISNKQLQLSQKIDIKFASKSEIIQTPVERTVNTIVFAPQTAAINESIRVFVQTTSDGVLVGGSPEKLLATSHIHLPTGEVISLATSFKTLHQGIYYFDYNPPKEGTYVFHIVSYSQGTVSHGSAATVVLRQGITGVSDQIVKLNSILESTSKELDTLKKEVAEFGNTLTESQKSLNKTNESIEKSVQSVSNSVNDIEQASGQFNSLFLPIVALIAIIVALQITIIARRR